MSKAETTASEVHHVDDAIRRHRLGQDLAPIAAALADIGGPGLGQTLAGRQMPHEMRRIAAGLRPGRVAHLRRQRDLRHAFVHRRAPAGRPGSARACPAAASCLVPNQSSHRPQPPSASGASKRGPPGRVARVPRPCRSPAQPAQQGSSPARARRSVPSCPAPDAAVSSSPRPSCPGAGPAAQAAPRPARARDCPARPAASAAPRAAPDRRCRSGAAPTSGWRDRAAADRPTRRPPPGPTAPRRPAGRPHPPSAPPRAAAPASRSPRAPLAASWSNTAMPAVRSPSLLPAAVGIGQVHRGQVLDRRRLVLPRLIPAPALPAGRGTHDHHRARPRSARHTASAVAGRVRRVVPHRPRRKCRPRGLPHSLLMAGPAARRTIAARAAGRQTRCKPSVYPHGVYCRHAMPC